MFRLFRAIFRLNLGGCVYIWQWCLFNDIAIYTHPEYGSKNLKHAAASCKFIKYLIKKVVLDCTLLHNLITRETHNWDA